MIDAKMPDNLPQWMKDHADQYLSSGGTEGHNYTLSRPGAGEIGRGRRKLEAAFPNLPFLWLDTEQSEGEVFWIARKDLLSSRA